MTSIDMCDEKKLFRPAFLTFAPLYHFTLSTHWKYHQKATGDYVIASYFWIECNTTNTDQSRWEGFFLHTWKVHAAALPTKLPTDACHIALSDLLPGGESPEVPHVPPDTTSSSIGWERWFITGCMYTLHSQLLRTLLLVERLTLGLFQKWKDWISWVMSPPPLVCQADCFLGGFCLT